MNYKIVSDSSSNVFTLPGVDYTTVPLKIVAGENEWVDNAQLDLAAMVDGLKKHKGKSGSSCPNVQEWLDAFEGGENILAMTISSNLSGSYAAAKNAAEEYMAEHPGANVFVLDSLSAGPEMGLLLDKFKEIMDAGTDFATACEQLKEYHANTHILFCLESLTNLARNGRVSKAAATIAGVLGIRAVGDVQHGQIIPVHKPRGAKGATGKLLEMMKERGFRDGNILRIAHCYGEEAAFALRDKVLAEFPNTRFILEPTTALCSFYAEAGGLIIGFEGHFNAENDNNKF